MMKSLIQFVVLIVMNNFNDCFMRIISDRETCHDVASTARCLMVHRNMNLNYKKDEIINEKFKNTSLTIHIETDFANFISGNLIMTRMHLTNQLRDQLFTEINGLTIEKGSVLVKFNVNGEFNISNGNQNKTFSITNIRGKKYFIKEISPEITNRFSFDNQIINFQSTESENISESENDLSEHKIQEEDHEDDDEDEDKSDDEKEENMEKKLQEKNEDTTEGNSVRQTDEPNQKNNYEESSPLINEQNLTTINSLFPSTEQTIEIQTTIETQTTETQTHKESPEEDGFDLIVVLEGNYEASVSKEKEKFIEHIKPQLAEMMRIPLNCFKNFKVENGSIVVCFTIIPSNDPNFIINEEGIENAKKELNRKAKEDEVVLTDLAENSLKIISVNFIKESEYPKINKRIPDTKKVPNISFEYIIIGLSVGAVVAMIVMVVITAYCVRAYMYKKFQRQITPETLPKVRIKNSLTN